MWRLEKNDPFHNLLEWNYTIINVLHMFPTSEEFVRKKKKIERRCYNTPNIFMPLIQCYHHVYINWCIDTYIDLSSEEHQAAALQHPGTRSSSMLSVRKTIWHMFLIVWGKPEHPQETWGEHANSAHRDPPHLGMEPWNFFLCCDSANHNAIVPGQHDRANFIRQWDGTDKSYSLKEQHNPPLRSPTATSRRPLTVQRYVLEGLDGFHRPLIQLLTSWGWYQSPHEWLWLMFMIWCHHLDCWFLIQCR